MSDQNTADNWRLEDSGDVQNQWKLQETEQNRISQWELQDEYPLDTTGWQPVEYERDSQRGGSWLLPLLVGVALVAVIAYGVWIGLGQLGIGGFGPFSNNNVAQSEPTPANVAVAVMETATPMEEAIPTEAPTATVTPAPTNTPEPTPLPTPVVPFVEQTLVTVTNQYGVNARSAPNTDTSEVLQVLEAGQQFLVVSEGADGWIQVAVPPSQRVWVSTDFVEQRTETVSLEVANQRRTAAGLEPIASTSPELVTAPPVAASPTAAAGAPVTATTESLTLAPTASVTTTVATPVVTAPITGTVNITVGLNARALPDTTSTTLATLDGGVVLTLQGRTTDSQWLLVELPAGGNGWVFAQYVTVNGDLTTIPVISEPTPLSAATAATATLTTTAGTTTTTLAPTPVAPTGAVAVQDMTATVSRLSGANMRLTPDPDTESVDNAPFDAILKVLGRSADNEWVQVEWTGGQPVWVLVSTVNLNTDVASLPVVTP
ncbi:MAG: SH3 domain-containing protein [Caldilineaceae bacterium]